MQATILESARMAQFYPLPDRQELLKAFKGVLVGDLPTPAAVVDRALVGRNCDAMLHVCKELGVGFRAHVKSHKTIELSKLQVGPGPEPARFIVSTLLEAEQLIPPPDVESPFGDRPISVLYGVPLALSHTRRLLEIARRLPAHSSMEVMFDDAPAWQSFYETKLALEAETPRKTEPNTPKSSSEITESRVYIRVWIKVDTGYHRAGVDITTNSENGKVSNTFQELVGAVAKQCRIAQDKGLTPIEFAGFYSHAGHSYAGNAPDDALQYLLAELRALEKAFQYFELELKDCSPGRGVLCLSVGATPTATAAQNLLGKNTTPLTEEIRTLIRGLNEHAEVEFHAGVYPLLDLQQVATHARPSHLETSTTTENEAAPEGLSVQPLSKSNIALQILAEVTSIYTDRSKPEALINAGCLALGREPCKSYPGWGIVSSKANDDPEMGSGVSVYDEFDSGSKGWVVGKVSQEHGILRFEGGEIGGENGTGDELKVGDKVLIWPNHACVAGAGFGWYYVVDSGAEGKGMEVVDIWVKRRGW